MKRNNIAGLVLIVFAVFLYVRPVYAAYVLPYPPPMPGNALYRVFRMLDLVKSYWNWGNIAGTRYSLSLSSKYLVEAKTLFEYGQYLLAVDALDRSNAEIQKVPRFLERAETEGKNTDVLAQEVADALSVHENVLTKLKTELPATFLWSAENAPPVTIPISELLVHAISIRNDIRDQLSP